jgi:Ca2+-dependent lipid-binding protein
LRLGSTLEQ